MKYNSSLPEIIAAVSDCYGIPADVLKTPSKRTQPVTHARHMAIYLACKLTWMSKRDIATYFNQHDHSSLYYGFNKISLAIVDDPEIKGQVEALSKQLEKVSPAT